MPRHIYVLTDPQCHYALLLLLHISLFGYKLCYQFDVYRICVVADPGSFSGPDCLFSLKLSMYVQTAGLQTLFAWVCVEPWCITACKRYFLHENVCPNWPMQAPVCCWPSLLQCVPAYANRQSQGHSVVHEAVPVTIVHCDERGLAQLTGCFAEYVCIAVSFEGMWVFGTLTGKQQVPAAVLRRPLYGC